MSEKEQIEIANEFDSNGKLELITSYCDGRKHGVEREFYYGGEAIRRETPYSHGRKDGVEKFFYENGNVRAEIPYTKNRRDGVEKHYYADGKLQAELPHIKGLQHGTCKWYNKDGTLFKEEVYNRGVSVESVYDEKYLEGLAIKEALIHEEFKKAEEMIENGADANAPYHANGWTPFLWICKEFGQGAEFRWYIEHGGDVNYKNMDGETAFHIIADQGKYYNLREFADLGCDFNEQDKNGNTPLMLAVGRWALRYGGSVPEEFFSLTDTSIKNKHGQTVFDIIEANWHNEPQRYYELMSNDRKNYDLALNLKNAIEKNDVEKVKSLLAQGAKVDFPLDSNGMTPFLWACRKCNNLEILQMLTDATKNIRVMPSDGMAPVALAVKYQKSAPVLELLLKNGADADVKDNKGNTPLMALLSDPKVSERMDEYQVLLSVTDLTSINKKGKNVIDYAKSNPGFNDEKTMEKLQRLYDTQTEANDSEITEDDIDIWVDGCVPNR